MNFFLKFSFLKKPKKLNLLILIGDQVLEWNGIPLTGLRNNEVQQIIMNSFGLEGKALKKNN